MGANSREEKPHDGLALSSLSTSFNLGQAGMSQPPPKDAGPPPPLIPLDIIDAPTQRLYLVAALILVQAYKLSHFLTPASTTSLSDPNWTLWKWILIDSLSIQVVKRLRVPRFNLGWKARWTAALALVGLDYLLFGRWTVSTYSLLSEELQGELTERTVPT